MGILDFILNLAALLVWLNWRSLRFDPLVRTSAASLAGTLKRAEARKTRAWHLVLGLVLLLFIRALVYWILGAPVEWTPKLHLGTVILAFRVDRLGTMLLFSLLSFVRVLVVFYFWLLIVALFNRRPAESDPLLKLLRLHLGAALRLPWPVMLLLVPILVAVLWMGLHPLLVYANVLPRSPSAVHLAQQALLLTAALVMTLKFVLPFFLLLHFVSTYVYLGSSPVWDFVSATANHIMRPLKRLPLRAGKLDLTPLVMTAVIFLLLDWVPAAIESGLARRGFPIWPQ